MDYLGKSDVLTVVTFNKFMKQIEEKKASCVHREGLSSLIYEKQELK